MRCACQAQSLNSVCTVSAKGQKHRSCMFISEYLADPAVPALLETANLVATS